MRRVFAALGAVAILIALASAGPASGEREQKGNLVATLQGKVAPLRLPRDHPAPVAIHLSGSIATADGSVLPHVTAMSFGLAGRGGIDTRGLPVCPLARIRHSRDREALAECAGALVGRGRVDARANIPGQPPLPIHASLLVFNGRAAGGATALLLHVYSVKPPISVVIPFVLRRHRGHFGSELLGDLPPGIGPWPSLADFSMTLSRRFSYHGSQHSFLVASCPLPHRLTSGLLSLARLGFTLQGDRRISTEIVRTCRAG
jgi:hypothetical protein